MAKQIRQVPAQSRTCHSMQARQARRTCVVATAMSLRSASLWKDVSPGTHTCTQPLLLNGLHTRVSRDTEACQNRQARACASTPPVKSLLCTASMDAAVADAPCRSMNPAKKDRKPRTNFGVRADCSRWNSRPHTCAHGLTLL